GRKPMLPRGLRLCAAWILALSLAWPGATQADGGRRTAPPDSGRWTESTRLLAGIETRLRLLTDMPSRAERAVRSHLVAVVWRYGEADAQRLLPSALDALRLVQAEALLDEGIERTGLAMLVATMTGGLQHEWLYY